MKRLNWPKQLWSNAVSKPVVNIYSLADAELDRLHRLMFEADRHAQMMSPSPHYSGSAAGSFSSYSYPVDPRMVFDRIARLNDAILEGIRTTDTKVQEKVAELALTDVQKENK